MSVQIAVIDDWQDVASGVVDWSVLQSVGQVHFLHDYPADTALMIERLKGFEVICVMRERSTFDKALLEGLPRLKLLVTGGIAMPPSTWRRPRPWKSRCAAPTVISRRRRNLPGH